MDRLCTWSDEGDSWTLRLSLPAESVPEGLGLAEAGVGSDSTGPSTDSTGSDRRELFADLNGITDRRDVPGGIMSLETADGEPNYLAELKVPRGFRGSLAFMPVPAGLETADRDTWLAALKEAFIPRETGMRIVSDMFGRSVIEVAAPDARPLIWTADTGSTRSEVGSPEGGTAAADAEADDPAVRTAGAAGPVERVDTLDSTPRRTWTYRPDRAPASAPVLVVFDGRAFVDGGLLTAIDELVSPPSLVLAVDHAPLDPASDSAGFELRASDLVMNPTFCDEVLELVESLAPESRSRTIIAGASYGGLAAAYFALRHPRECRGICLSPSFWETDAQGDRIWDHVPEGIVPDRIMSEGIVPRDDAPGDRAAGGPCPEFVIDHGTLETTIADSVAEAVPEFAKRGLSVEARTFSGGHEYLWWRELLLVHLAEVLAETPDLSRV